MTNEHRRDSANLCGTGGTQGTHLNSGVRREAKLKEKTMADDMKKDQGQNPGRSGDQSGEQQHRDPQDVTKKNPGQDREQNNNEENRQEQDDQRRAS